MAFSMPRTIILGNTPSPEYENVRDLPVKNPRLAARVGSQLISEARKVFMCRHLSEDGYTLSTASPIRFLRRLCTKPGAVAWDDTEPDPLRPIWDHPFCFNHMGKPAFLVLHPYHRPTMAELEQVIDWCRVVGLSFQVDADSEYFPGITLRVCIYAEGKHAACMNIRMAC